MRSPHLFIVSLAGWTLFLSFTGAAFGQQPKNVQVYVEDPELYFAFFRAHTVADLKIQASATAVASQLAASTAAAYHITADDLPNLTAQVRKFNAQNGALFLQQQAYLSSVRAAKKQPDIKTLVNYQWQRQRLVMNTQAQIRGALKQANWSALYGYITGDFATALHASTATPTTGTATGAGK
jgi:hypothetical protein